MFSLGQLWNGRVFLATPTTLSYDNHLLCMFTPVLYKLTKDLFFKANFFLLRMQLPS